MRYLCFVTYDGAAYFGWQKQINEISVQQIIEEKLSKILNTPTKIYGSGRTDAKVHALKQSFHFDIEKDIDKDRLLYSMNQILPEDIKLLSIDVVNEDFSARFNVKEKTYVYRFNVGEEDIFLRNYEYQIKQNIDIEKIKSCLHLFVGKHNFKAFTRKKEDMDNYIREIFSFELIHIEKGHYAFVIKGNGFMRYMVRMIVGLLFEIGIGREKEDIINIALNEPETVLPYIAKPYGLYLYDIKY